MPFLWFMRLFSAGTSALGEGPRLLMGAQERPGSEAVGSLPKVTLPFAFLENGKVWLC